jgi:hypothetical protein
VAERSGDGRFDLSYLHLSAIAVRRGDAVTAGGAIGAVGISGRRSVAAPHLHFGVRDAGSRSAYHDPLDFLSPPTGDRAPRPAPSPVPVAHPAAPSRARAPHGGPRRIPVLRPARSPQPARIPLPRATPVPHSHHAARSESKPRPAAQPLRGPGYAPARTPAHPTLPHVAAPKPTSSDPGINVGWLAACVGLVAAATALGRPDATRKLALRSRTRLSGLLRLASREG